MLYSVDFFKRFGRANDFFERKEMVLYIVPKWARKAMPCLPKKIYCNKQLEIPLETSFYNIIDRSLEKEVKTWDGCFNPRPIRGYKGKYNYYAKRLQWFLAAKFMSVHSWGCAIDINSKDNGLGKEPKMSRELVKCFTDAGFIWGGDFTRKDGMHFQLAYLN